MIEIDREPPANIEARLISPEVPLNNEPQKEEIVGIGRNRFVIKFLSIITRGTSYVKDAVYLLKRHFKGRGGRGICQGCSSGTEDNHHGGSRCRRRGMSRFNQKSQLIPSTIIGKLALNSS